MSSGTNSTDESISIREIHKTGWLKKFVQQDKNNRCPPNKVPILTKGDKLWVVFCIHEDDDPYLEGYTNQTSSLSHKPLEKWHLKNCQHICPNILPEDDEHLFTITLNDHCVHLSASSRDQMIEWIDTIRLKLDTLGIISPRDNIYSKEPELKSPLAQTRDPTSPLPPTPSFTFSLTGIIPNSSPPATSRESDSITSTNPLPLPLDVNTRHEAVTPAPYSAPVSSYQMEASAADRNIFSFDGMLNTLPSRPYSWTDFSSTETSNEQTASPPESDASPLYEPLYLAHTAANPSDQSVALNSSNNELGESYVRNSPHTNEPPRLHRQISSETTTSQEDGRGGETSESLSLKQKQILQLQKEIRHPGGIRLKLRLKDCTNSIAFIDLFGAVWIAGWKQKEHPFLYNSFHIGDKIISIDHLRISNSSEARRVIKQTYTPSIEFVVARLPFGRAIAIRREFEGQGLGIERERNTAEIKNVVLDGLAARHGLPVQATSLQGNSLCNWVLTEINGRPLNLFCKNDEQIEARLMAVGKDITILVQPVDFIKALKRQLKALRSYKDYIVQ